MTCAHCIRKDEELRILRRELGIRQADGEIGAVMIRLGVNPMQARMLLMMYRAKGKTVHSEVLRTQVANDSCDGTIKVHIHQMRKVLGRDAIATAERVGYALTPMGWSLVHGALRPPEMQEVRSA